MLKIIADASLGDLSCLSDHFSIDYYYNEQDLREKIREQDILLCRSTLKVTASLLAHSAIRCVATASSGTDHIDASYMAQHRIQVLDAKGANACAVADYVISAIAYGQLHGFFSKKHAGIMGCGIVGTAVMQRLNQIGFKISLYDPLRALYDKQFISCELASLFDCDLICVHANLHDGPVHASRHLLNASVLSQFKANTVIINAARGDIVDEIALLRNTHPLHYCTDVYAKEPEIHPAIIQYATLCTPHIAGHSIEARQRALVWISQKIYQWSVQGAFKCLTPGSLDMTLPILQDMLWSKKILSLYNPEWETIALKQAKNLPQKFLELRKAHHNRHDFIEEK